jgi:hypothetical protein
MYLTLIILPLLGSIASGLLVRIILPDYSFVHWLNGAKVFAYCCYSTIKDNIIVLSNNYYYTGFLDAESSFKLKIVKNKKYSTGWHIQPVFSIQVHKRDLPLLEQINNYFGGFGKIYNNGEDGVLLDINSREGLNQIINHLDKYPLVTQKKADFELFKRAVEIISRKGHLSLKGLQQLVSIRASMNKGLPDELNNAFPNIKPVQRPTVEFKGIPDPHWVAGFVDGEGCFFVSVVNSLGSKLGVSVSLEFIVTQHSRDEELINSFINYLGCGRMKLDRRFPAIYFVVSRFADVTGKIIPFFKKYPLQSVKSFDYENFCKVAEIMKVKGHLTAEGLEQTRKIKSVMNKSNDSSNRLRGTEKQKIKKKCI